MWEGSDKNCRLQIAFQNQGIKWLIAHLANLENCDPYETFAL